MLFENSEVNKAWIVFEPGPVWGFWLWLWFVITSITILAILWIQDKWMQLLQASTGRKQHLFCVCVYTLSLTLEIKTSKVICFDIFTNAFKTRNWFGLWKCITLQIARLFGPYLSNQFCIQHPELLRNVSLWFKSILTLSGQMILMLA